MKLFTKSIKSPKILLVVMLLISAYTHAQLKQPFSARFNEAVNGDFTIIANNMVSTTATGDHNGNDNNHDFSNMVYVDIDSDITTFNSSSANFTNPTPIMSCLTIRKVYLYWAAADLEPNDSDPNSDNQPGWNYNDIKVMLPSETSYTTLTADEVIYRGREDHIGPPDDGHFSNDPYICVKDITTDVNALANPYGTYQVANVEAKIGQLVEHGNGPGSPTGVSGGWQIVFVYESPSLPLKNISIFDGYGHVTFGTGGYDINFNGFQTVPSGNVNAKILVGALEGDRNLTGDRLQILDTSNNFSDLSVLPVRTDDNFFNSSITIDNTNFLDRNPASLNTLGFDAAVFDLDNPGNSIIGTGQTSATIRLNSNFETYGLFLLGFSVDVWEPNLGPIQVLTNVSSTPQAPGTSIGANFNIENKGNDNAVDVTISSTLPPQLSLVEPIIGLPAGINYTYTSGTGDLIFTLDNGLADVGDPAIDVNFDVVIKDECYFLEQNCDLSFGLQFVATYNGVQNPMEQTTNSSSSLNSCGVGNNEETIINVIQPTVSWQTPVGDLDSTIQCNDATALSDAQALVPVVDKCAFTLIKTSGSFSPDPSCPGTGTYTNTWNFTDACGNTSPNYTQTITVVDTTAPVIDNTAGDLDANLECSDAAGIAAALALVPTATDNCTTPTINMVSDDTTVDPNCANAYVQVRVWNFTDGCGNTSPNFTQTITVVDTTAPVIDNTAGDLDANLECSDAAGIAAALALVPTATDNCTTPTINMVSDDTTVDPNCANAYVQVRVWNFTDGCGNTSPNFTQTITVVDTTAPVIDNTAGDLDANLECSDAAGIAAALALVPTATDNCTTPTINMVSDDTTVDPNCANAYVQVRVWNFTDGCGNTSPNFTQTITVVDTTAPVIDNTAGDLDANLECSDAAGIAAALALVPTATDNCTTPTINMVSDDTTVDPNCANAYVQVRVWNFTDGCGNTSPNFTQTITVVDTTAPVIDNTAGDLDANLECSDAAGIAAALALVPTATDNCTTPTINMVSDDTTVDPNCANAYVQVRVWNFTDGCGNTSPNFTQTITVVDTTAPVIDNTAGDLDANLECSDAAGIAAALALVPTATDNCTTPTINMVSDDTTVDPNCANAYVQVRVWNFTDGCGNTSPNFTQTITVVDTTAPVIDNTAGDLDANLECSDAAGIAAALALVPTATDNCTTPTINMVSDDTTVDPNCANAYVQVRVWNFTDGCGNTSPNFTQTITVVDTTAPVIDNTAGDLDANLECSDAAGIAAALALVPTATDNCTTPTINMVSDDTTVDPNCANAYVQVRVWNFTDGCGNTSPNFTQTITVVDTTAPVIDNTAGDLDANLECSDAAGIAAALALVPTATDNCTTPTINMVSDDTTVDPNCANAYVQVRVWNFTDGCGNTSPNFTQTITVVDTTAPVIDNTAGDLDANLECSDAAGIAAALALVPTATDNCTTPTINMVSDDTTVDPNCANAYVQVRVWNFTDGCGNTSPNFTQTITVVDTTAPVIDNTNTSNIEIECGIGDTQATLTAWLDSNAGATATDNCGAVTWSNDYGSDDSVQCDNGAITVTFTATDECGNQSTTTATYLIKDTEAPVIDNTAGDLDATLECSDTSGIAAALALVPTAMDDCSASTINIVSDDTTTDPNCANAYVQVRVWNFTDGCGNTSPNFTQTITVVDTTAPVIDNTAGDLDANLECSDAAGIAAALALVPTATDNCTTPTINMVSDDTTVDPNCANAYVQVRVWNFTDACGNTSPNFTQTITVVDTTAPVIDNTAGDLDANLECSDAAGIAAALALVPTATDNCTTPTINMVSDDTTVDPNCANAYVQVRVWNFTDGCGNTSPNFTQTITVVDTTAPVIDNTAGDLDANLECSDAAGIAAALALVPTATDNCTTPTINMVSDDTTVDPNCANAYVQVRVWNFTDGCGNTSPNFTQTITVVDTTAPVIDNTAGDLDANLECSDAAGIAAALALVPTATDNCTTPTINMVSDDTTVDPNCANAYVQVRVWNFTDGCGNTSPNFTQTITVVDTTAPVIDNTAGDLDANLECSDAAGIAAALALVPTATDNCTTPTINMVSDDTTVDPNCANAYVQVRVWNFTDGCGNTSPNFTQTITVVDTTAPVIDNTNTSNIEIECGIGDTQATLTAWLDSNAGATATDNCGAVTWSNDYGSDDSVQCDNGAITVTFTATDECGNQSTTTATYLIKDTEAPVIDNTAGDLDATLECSDTSGIAAALALVPTAMDDCSASTINIVSDDTTTDPNCANAYVQVRVWNFTDGCGNTSPNFTQTITVVDTTAPVIDNTAGDLDANLECSDAAGIAAALALVPTATDNCTTPTINMVSDDTTVDPNCANAYVQVRVWNFTDACGNTSPNFTQTITVVDTTAPVIDNTAGDLDANLECSDAAGIAAALALVPTATDNCTTPTINMVSDDTTVDPNCANAYVQVRVWNFTDGCGNTSPNFTQTITVVDTTAPVIDNTAGDLDANLECSDAAGIAAALALVPTATDNCTTPTINMVSDDTTVDPNCANAYVQVRVWNFTDGCGNTSPNFTQTITVVDTTAPVIDNTAGDLDANLECSDAAGIAAALALVPTATDNCTTPTINMVSDDTTVDPNCANAYVQVRVWNFTDGCGNTSPNFTQTITVVDTTAPVIDNTAGDLDANLECSDAAGIAAALALVPTATDNCTTPTINMVSDDTTVDPNCANAYVQVRVWNFTDGCGNTSPNFTQTITVVDTTAPVIDNTAGDLDASLECSDAAGIAAALALVPTATDNCTTPTINMVSDDTTVDPNCANAYVQVRVWNFTDGCGNTSPNFTQTITVVDTTAPVIDNTNTSNIEIECGIGDTQATLTAWLDSNAGATATDNCGAVTWSNDYGSDDSVQCDNGAITVTFTATDECGNQSTTTATYLIKDTEAPVIDNTAGDLDATLECSDTSGIAAALALVPTAMDDCSASTINIVSDDTTTDPNCANAYVQVRVWNFTDACGNISANFTQTITVVDTTAPVIDNTAGDLDANLECSDASGIAAALALAPTATDNCTTPTINIVSDDITVDPDCANAYVQVRVWNFSDACGNTSPNFTQTITVVDTTAPVLSLPANITAECSDDLTPVAFGTATATDNCDSNPVVTYVDVITNGSCPGSFTITRTWTAIDTCGNSVSANQIISTSDTTAPEFVEDDLPEDFTVECDVVPAAETLTATDNCGTATVELSETRTDGNCPNNYTITRVWTATDECGLTNTHVQVVTVQDTTAPEFVESLPTNITVECDAVPTAETITATDTCGSASVSVNDVITDGSCPSNYFIARTWTATDECGLTRVHTQIITVQDTTRPEFVEDLPNDITVECDAVPTAETITATDNCGDATVTMNDVISDGNCPSNYVITRTWTATDECGLITSHTQVITVQDTTAPTPTTTFEEVIEASCTDVPDAPELEFTDNCSTNVTVVFNETNSFDENNLVDYQIVRTWIVADECNNIETYTQTINVSLDEVVTEVIAADRCYDDGVVDLNSLISTTNLNGTWEIIEGDTAATITGNIFDPSGLELSEDFLPHDGGIDYVLRYSTTEFGCISIFEVTMNIHADCVVLPCGENDVVISKALTPNGDSYNESFDITGIELCGFTADVKIFNRWGALIYESNSYQTGPGLGAWKGSARKSVGAAGKVPNGTYYYIVTLKDSGLKPFTGPVYLGTK